MSPNRMLVVVGSSLLLALVSLFLRWCLLEDEPVTTVKCEGENERSVCLVSSICYKKNERDGRHVLQAPYTTHEHEGPLAYLIAPDIFPQSAVYLSSFVGHVPTVSQTFTSPAAFLMMRFKPDNIMHVIHDDLLPIYATLSEHFPLSRAPFPVRLVFADPYGVMPYDQLYASLTSYDLVYNASLSTDSLCFEQLLVGFNKKSLWYQYGFRSPQGRLPHDAEYIRKLIYSFRDCVPTLHQPSSQPNRIGLFSRTDTRLILNEAELSLGLAQHFSASVKSIDLETLTLQEVIFEVSKSNIIIGMHGALFVSILWAPRNAKVLELFPYAVPADQYAPYRTLAEILGLQYMSWTNIDIHHTVGHVNYPKQYGGLLHLQPEVRDQIIEQTRVPPHLCCEDPSWLYHIYQDTLVNVTEIIHILDE